MSNIGLRQHSDEHGVNYLWFDNGKGYCATHLGVFRLSTKNPPKEESFKENRWTSIGYTIMVKWQDE